MTKVSCGDMNNAGGLTAVNSARRTPAEHAETVRGRGGDSFASVSGAAALGTWETVASCAGVPATLGKRDTGGGVPSSDTGGVGNRSTCSTEGEKRAGLELPDSSTPKSMSGAAAVFDVQSLSDCVLQTAVSCEDWIAGGSG